MSNVAWPTVAKMRSEMNKMSDETLMSTLSEANGTPDEVAYDFRERTK